MTYAFDYATALHLEVLVPAFALGCVIKSDHLHGSAEYSGASAKPAGREPLGQAVLDWGIKGGFMLLATLIGLGPETGLALALVKRVRELAFGVPGLLAWQLSEGWTARLRRRAAS